MCKRFRVIAAGNCWLLIDCRDAISPCGTYLPRTVQTFPTRTEARKWAKLANHPRAALAWGDTGKLISMQIADGASGVIVHV